MDELRAELERERANLEAERLRLERARMEIEDPDLAPVPSDLANTLTPDLARFARANNDTPAENPGAADTEGSGRAQCPACFESIDARASVCPFCRSEIAAVGAPTGSSRKRRTSRRGLSTAPQRSGMPRRKRGRSPSTVGMAVVGSALAFASVVALLYAFGDEEKLPLLSSRS